MKRPSPGIDGLTYRAAALTTLAVMFPVQAFAQRGPGQQRSGNMTYVSHLPLGMGQVADIEVEQELSRPYVYVARSDYNPSPLGPSKGTDIISIKDPARPKLLYRFRLEGQELHERIGGLDNKYFKLGGRYYDVQSFQLIVAGPDGDLGAVVLDVTGLPDPSSVKVVATIRTPDTPGGFHSIFAYRHSNGRAYLFATVESSTNDGQGANIYDMARLLGSEPLVGRVPLPEPRGAGRGFHDAYVAYHVESGQDRFYGGGPETTYLGGNFVFDVSDIEQPKLLSTILAVPSQQSGGHTFVVTPDGRYGLTEMTSLGHTPIRIFDLQPALDGERTVLQPIAEWTADPTKSQHNLEVRWPYVFVSAYQAGVHVFYMRDPTNPHTVAFYDTHSGVQDYSGGGTGGGVFGVDVRNADGLIVAGDIQNGFWAFKLERFEGWNGHDWGVPNISSAQDWDNGPDGAPSPARVSMRGPAKGWAAPRLDYNKGDSR